MNFNVYAVRDKEVLESFMVLDKLIFGKIDGVTDKKYYTEGFCVPENYNISTDDKIDIESKYHSLTNGGHLLTIDMGIKSKEKPEKYEKMLVKMKEAGIGLGSMIIK